MGPHMLCSNGSLHHALRCGRTELKFEACNICVARWRGKKNATLLAASTRYPLKLLKIDAA